MNYKEASIEILKFVGGNENIESFTNCMTRLRIDVKDTSKVNVAAIKELKGVMGVVVGDQTQIIVGPGHAQRLKDEFAKISNAKVGTEIKENNADFKDVAGEMKSKVKASQKSKIQAAFQHVGNIFIPLIPGFVACGLITAIANVWKTMIDKDIVTNPWFLLFAAMGGLVGGMLHIITGYNAGKEFGGSPILGAIAGAFIYLPSLNGIPAVGDVAAQKLMIPLLNIELKSGLGGVIGVIIAALIFAIIEKKIRTLVPASLDLFLVPFLTIIIGSVITLFIIMPISAILMKGITFVLVDIALKNGGLVGGFILSSLFLPLVMLGIHQGLTPVHAQLIADTGHTVLLPILATAGAGQVGMAMAIYVKTKNKKLKEIISSALPIGFLGIGEPLIYGVSLPLFYPFITACIGAGFGGAVIAFATKNIGDVGAIAIGPSGLVLLPLIANGMWVWYLLGLISSYIGGFVLTYFFGYNEKMLERM